MSKLINVDKLKAWLKDNFFGLQVTADPNSYAQLVDILQIKQAIDSGELDADEHQPVCRFCDEVLSNEYIRDSQGLVCFDCGELYPQPPEPKK